MVDLVRVMVGLGESLEADESPPRVTGLKSLELVQSLVHQRWIFIASAALSAQERWRWRRVMFRLGLQGWCWA